MPFGGRTSSEVFWFSSKESISLCRKGSLAHLRVGAGAIAKLYSQAASGTSTSPIMQKIRRAEDMPFGLPFRTVVVTLVPIMPDFKVSQRKRYCLSGEIFSLAESPP